MSPRRDLAALAAALTLGCGAGATPSSAAVRGTGSAQPHEATDEEPSRPVALALTGGRSCALTADRNLYCWGGDAERPRSIAQGVSELLGSGSARPCYRLADGRLDCQGAEGEVRAFDMAEESLRCAIVSDGRATCRFADEPEWRDVPGLRSASALSVGSGFACAIRDGAVLCWGRNDFRQLGGEGREDREEAAAVELPAPASQVVAGTMSACALLETGEIYCWGSGASGGVGNEEFTVEGLTPRPLAYVEGAEQLADRCALLRNGEVRCWGRWPVSQMLPCDHRARARHPGSAQPVPGIPPMRLIASSGTHACGVGDDDSLWCWGANESGQLGDGTRSDHPDARRVWLEPPAGPRDCADDAILGQGRITRMGLEPSLPQLEVCVEAAEEETCFRYDVETHEVRAVRSLTAPPPPRAPSARGSWVVRRVGALLSLCPREGTACREATAPAAFLHALDTSGELGEDAAILRPPAMASDDGEWLGLAWTDPPNTEGAYVHHVEIRSVRSPERLHSVREVGPEGAVDLRVVGGLFVYRLNARNMYAYDPRAGRPRRVGQGRPDLSRLYPLRSGRALYVPVGGHALHILEENGALWRRQVLRRALPEGPPTLMPLWNGGYAIALTGDDQLSGGVVLVLDGQTGALVGTLEPPRCDTVRRDIPSCR